jgi:hypothetical protein
MMHHSVGNPFAAEEVYQNMALSAAHVEHFYQMD